jgi:hypothetical protein
MNLKIFPPVENYTMVTNLSTEETAFRLDQKIGPTTTLARFFWGDVTSKPYEGYFVSNSFEIKRSIGYRNSFLPVISGYIYSLEGKTYIKIEMKILDWVLYPVMILIGLGFLISVFNGFGGQFLPGRITPFLITAFAYLVVYFAFKIESGISKRFLAKLLEWQKINS